MTSLKKQLLLILCLPLLLGLATNFYILTYMRDSQENTLKNACYTAIENININASTLTNNIKKTSSTFTTNQSLQEYLSDSTTDPHSMKRQSYSDSIDLARAYTSNLVDILVWDGQNTTSMISYISSDMENFAVSNLENSSEQGNTFFQIYMDPKSQIPYIMYFAPIYKTTFSPDFGKYLGAVVTICDTETLDKLVHSTTDILVSIEDAKNNKTLYSNKEEDIDNLADNSILYESTVTVPFTNLNITGSILKKQVRFFSSHTSTIIMLIASLSVFYILYTGVAVHLIIIRPIRKLNRSIEQIDYEKENTKIESVSKNEIGSIASKINSMLSKIFTLNEKNITSQARLYEMEISKKQTQLYAYQSQINPHFLYNMLQCMRGISLIHDMPQLAAICTNMADLFRYSIKGANYVQLKDEVQIIEEYLYMIAVRFQDRINYNVQIDENALSCRIPKMILQPLVENAIFHGLESIEEQGELFITGVVKGNDLIIQIKDNGIGFSEEVLDELKHILSEDIPTDINSTFNEEKGLGIINIHNKIRLYEGNQYGIQIDSSPYNTIVRIVLNAFCSK